MENSITTPGRGTHPMIIIAAIAVTLFALAGTAAIMGWIPSSTGKQAATEQIADARPPAAVSAVEAPAQPVQPTKAAPRQVTAPKRTVENRPASAPDARTQPVQVAAVTPAYTPPPAPAPIAQVEPATPPRPACFDCGTIESVREVQKKGEGSGLGAVAGGVLGGLLGNQVGGGRGRDAMTVVGAVGGAVAGHQVEKNTKSTVSYDITVRFEDGTTRTIQQSTAPVWRSGDRVRVINGEIVPNG